MSRIIGKCDGSIQKSVVFEKNSSVLCVFNWISYVMSIQSWKINDYVGGEGILYWKIYDYLGKVAIQSVICMINVGNGRIQ
jgi:hypothetical protein